MVGLLESKIYNLAELFKEMEEKNKREKKPTLESILKKGVLLAT